MQFVGGVFLEEKRRGLRRPAADRIRETRPALLQCSAHRRAEHCEPAAHRLATAALQFLFDKIVPGVMIELVARPILKELGERQ